MTKKINQNNDYDTPVQQFENNVQPSSADDLEKEELILSNNMKVIVNEPTTPQVMRCREMANPQKPSEVYLLLAADCCEFDGKMFSPVQITSLRSRDYLTVEACLRGLLGEKN